VKLYNTTTDINCSIIVYSPRGYLDF